MLTLICGLPRAGKTTYSKQYDNVIHLDGLGYHKVNDIIQYVTNDIVVEGVYNMPIFRSKLVEKYKGKGTHCIWLDTPLEVRKQRPMWSTSINMDFIPPTYDEGWDRITILKGE